MENKSRSSDSFCIEHFETFELLNAKTQEAETRRLFSGHLDLLALQVSFESSKAFSCNERSSERRSKLVCGAGPRCSFRCEWLKADNSGSRRPRTSSFREEVRLGVGYKHLNSHPRTPRRFRAIERVVARGRAHGEFREENPTPAGNENIYSTKVLRY